MPRIVFDIDDCICKNPSFLDATTIQDLAPRNPECVILNYTSKAGDTYPHIFIPHIGFLFEYLLEHNATITFFSSAIAHRNETLIPELLKQLLGDEKYERLKAEGQFEIFSRKHMREGKYYGEGNNVKDFKDFLKEGEDINDVILVEDDKSYTAHDQKPCILTLDCLRWWPEIESQDSKYVFSKNTSYHLLGLFEEYFTEYAGDPIRKAFTKIFPTFPIQYEQQFSYRRFKFEKIKKGYELVQKSNPEAQIYGLDKYKYYDNDSPATIYGIINGIEKEIRREEEEKAKRDSQLDKDGYIIFTDSSDEDDDTPPLGHTYNEDTNL